MLKSAEIILCDSCHTDSPSDAPACVRCGEELTGAAARPGDALVGLEIAGKYRLEEHIGEGSMGWVYRAVHRTLQTDVAVKLMKPASEDPERHDRFEREARLAGRLSHPHVISVTDFGNTPGGLLYIVSEFIRGRVLGDVIREDEPLPLGRALTLFHQILAAVEEAHSMGLVHRDIKPDNIMITSLRSGESFVKVLDFGIAQLADGGDVASGEDTRTGLAGTPSYMAPEQIRSEKALPQSDLYSCGLILYELLVWQRAFRAQTMMEVLAQQLHASPVPLREAAPSMDYPEALEKVLDRALAKDPGDRYATAAELRDAVLQSVESVREAQVTCTACHHRPESSWSPHCTGCGFRPAFSSASGVVLATSAEPPVTVEASPTPRVLSGPDKEPREPSVITAVTVELPALEDDAPPAQRETPGATLWGRDAELGEVNRFLGSADTVLEVIGGPGMGKTAVLQEVGCRALGRCITVGADPSLGRTPWFPIREAVAQLLGLPDQGLTLDLLRTRALEAGLLAGDVPGLADLFGLERTVQGVATLVRARETRAAALRALLHSTTAQQGCCLLLDDADEYDGATKQFVWDLASGELAGTTKLVVAGRRSVLPGDGGHTSLLLPPLDLGALEELARARAPKRRDHESLARSLHSFTAGNPLHAEQALALLLHGGGLPDGDLEEVVRERLKRLSEPALELLQTLCLAGNEVEVQDLMKLMSGAVTFATLLQELSEAGFVTKRGNRLQVVSPSVGELVRGLVAPEPRAVISRRLHERLVARGGGVIQRSRHAAEARMGEDSLALLLQAGELASGWLDDDGAAAHYRKALDVARWELLMGEEDMRLPLISLKLGDALRRSEHFLAAEMTYKEALSACARYPELRARLLRGMGLLLSQRGLHDEALSVMRQALSQAENAAEPELVVELYVDLCDVLRRAGRHDKAAAESEEGIFELSGSDRDSNGSPPRGFWRLLTCAADLRRELDDLSASTEIAKLALQQARREKSLLGEAQSHLLLARLQAEANPGDGFDEHCDAAALAFRRLGDRRGVAESLLLQASVQPGTGGELVQQALDLARQVDWVEGVEQALQLQQVQP